MYKEAKALGWATWMSLHTNRAKTGQIADTTAAEMRGASRSGGVTFAASRSGIKQ